MTFLAFLHFRGRVLCGKTNRTPFDLPEAEQELAGVTISNTAPSSSPCSSWGILQHDSRVRHDGDVVLRRLDIAVVRPRSTGHHADRRRAAHQYFPRKVILFLVMFIWIRWMWPRFRYDQLMDLGWRRFIPVALVNILITPSGSVAERQIK